MEFLRYELIFEMIFDGSELQIHGGGFEDIPQFTERIDVLNRVLFAQFEDIVENMF